MAKKDRVWRGPLPEGYVIAGDDERTVDERGRAMDNEYEPSSVQLLASIGAGLVAAGMLGYFVWWALRGFEEPMSAISLLAFGGVVLASLIAGVVQTGRAKRFRERQAARDAAGTGRTLR